jgi:hypothetical protein
MGCHGLMGFTSKHELEINNKLIEKIIELNSELRHFDRLVLFTTNPTLSHNPMARTTQFDGQCIHLSLKQEQGGQPLTKLP